MGVRLFYERRLGSLAAVVSEAETMDADAGIRVSGKYAGRNCYVFVTRFGGRYTVMVYERRVGRRKGLSTMMASVDLEGTRQLKSFLGKVVYGKVEAFAY